MASLNKVLLLGNLTRDPELRYTPSGMPVCEFGLATNRRIPTQGGETREEVCFVDVVLYGKRAEAFSKYFSKGRPAFIEGRLEFRQWETPEGQKRNRLRVVAEDWQFVAPAPGGSGGARAAAGRASARPAEGAAVEPAPAPAPEEAPVEEGPLEAEPQDTPF
ncbi:MAG TPA: single-stranded DNA-binding protein [Planctomycetota bacterium]|jgi:single-strand DNA-binding protein|nr:single-stranded DNA-binding protein [Planctomycetota bacterium]